MQSFRLPFFLTILLLCCLAVAELPAVASSNTTHETRQQAETEQASPFNSQAELPVYPPDDPTTLAARTSKRIDSALHDHPLRFMGAISILFVLLLVLLLVCLGNKCSRICRMEAQLNKDELTGLPNMEKLKSLCAGLLTTQVTADYMLLSGDICQFKTINDQFGFGMGDRLLQAYASILQRNVLPEECCARISSDLFVLLLRFESWEQLAARIREMDNELDEWRKKQALPYTVRTVYGAYHVPKAQQYDVQLMLDMANYARLEAKRSSGIPMVLYNERMRQEALLCQELNGKLDEALNSGEIEVWHQAKVDMRTGTIVGSEALVRWNHPQRGLLLPGSFIPLFERNGLVTGIDFYVFEQTCRSLRSWKVRNLPLHPVSCNFSRLHFERPNFTQRLADIADRHGVPRHLLEIEITESAIMNNPDAVWVQIVQLKEMGFKTAIDDFGAGYSSLGIVQMLDTDCLKIDRSFIQRDLPGIRAQIVLGNIIRLADDLGMNVICEGVETAEQSAIIMKLGCYTAQGFFYAKPEPTHDFEARLAMQGM